MLKLEVIKTVSGRWKIVDGYDDGSPLVSFHNEANTEEVAIKVQRYLAMVLDIKAVPESETLDA